MKKVVNKKPPSKKIKKISKSNLESYNRSFRNMLSIAFFLNFTALFIGLNMRLSMDMDKLPETGEEIVSDSFFDMFVRNLETFIYSREGMVYLVILIMTLMVLVYLIIRTNSSEGRN